MFEKGWKFKCEFLVCEWGFDIEVNVGVECYLSVSFVVMKVIDVGVFKFMFIVVCCVIF